MKHSLKQAIKLHEKHMVNPSNVTMKSQRQLMLMMKKHQKEMSKNPKKEYEKTGRKR